ncbi:hypothetical protein PENTCL1PPCAC_15695, partial [Pristionchus entomophagus]
LFPISCINRIQLHVASTIVEALRSLGDFVISKQPVRLHRARALKEHFPSQFRAVAADYFSEKVVCCCRDVNAHGFPVALHPCSGVDRVPE